MNRSRMLTIAGLLGLLTLLALANGQFGVDGRDPSHSRQLKVGDFEVSVPEGGVAVVSKPDGFYVIKSFPSKSGQKTIITHYSKTTFVDGKPEKTVITLD